MERKKNYVQVGECPHCGAPLMVHEDVWKQAMPIYDEAYESFHMPGVIYTCRCYRAAQLPKITWTGTSLPDPSSDDSNKFTWEHPLTPKDTAGNSTL